MTQHPIQRIVTDIFGKVRFQENPLIRHIVRHHVDLNMLTNLVERGIGSNEDYDQILQLIGYSVEGAPLSPLTRARVDAAKAAPPPQESASRAFSNGYLAGLQCATRRLNMLVCDLEELR